MKTNHNNKTTPSELPSADTKEAPFYVLSPDGIPLRPEPFTSIAVAEQFVREWCESFKEQGYYAGVGYRLSLDELSERLEVVPLDYFEDEDSV